MEIRPITTSGDVGTRGALIRRFVVMLVLFGLIAAGVVGWKMYTGAARQAAMRAQGGIAQTVSTITAQVEDWTPQVAAVGSLKAVNGADLSFEVSGIVDEINFNSGDDVQAGAVLMRLRSNDETARLRSLEAMARLANITYQRNLELSKSQNVSQATLDVNEANMRNAQALVAQQQAIVDKKTLRAPFAGQLGLRAVDRGQYVNAGANIVTLQSLDPIYLDFYMPQQDLDRVKVGQAVTAHVDTYGEQDFTGEILAINPKVDAANRNVQVRAIVPNKERKLFPGMYATIKVAAGDRSRNITIPQTAVIYSPYGDAVYILDKKGEDQYVARYTFVTLGETRGDMVAVTSGVKEGEQVVSAGAIKLRNGAAARIDNSVQPTSDLNPKPAIP